MNIKKEKLIPVIYYCVMVVMWSYVVYSAWMIGEYAKDIESSVNTILEFYEQS